MARSPRIPRPRPLLAPDPERGETEVLPEGTELVRVYFAGGRHPGGWNVFRRYGPTSSRFDHHLPPARMHADRAILYGALDVTTAIGEVFQASGTVDVVSDDPYLVVMRLRRAVDLLSLRSNWPTRAGASQALATGPRAIARGWSVAIHEDLPAIQGLVYDSSMNRGGVNVALYERALDAIDLTPVVHLPLSHRGLRIVLRNAAAELRFGLVLPRAP